MSRLNQKGFTLNELLIVLLISSLLITTLYVFTSNTVNSYMKMQAVGLAQSKLSDGSFRISQVLRGVNYIESASDDGITAYAYFAPQDAYTSKISYYLSADQTKLLADVTPMTADYPVGSLITANKKTVVVIDGFYKVAGSPTFTYYTSNYSQISSPVTDLQSIKNVSIKLNARIYNSSNQEYSTSSVSVNLRNRKTNL